MDSRSDRIASACRLSGPLLNHRGQMPLRAMPLSVRFGSMLSKKSKIERLRKSREDQFLVVSAAASPCRAFAKACDRFCMIRCGSLTSPHVGRTAARKNFVRRPEKSFSTASVIRVTVTMSLSLPLIPRSRRYSGHRDTSHSCHHRKSVDLSITSSAVLDKASRLHEQKASAVLVIV